MKDNFFWVMLDNSFVRFVIVSLGGVGLNYILYYFFTRMFTFPFEMVEGMIFPLIGRFTFFHYTLVAEFWAIVIVLFYNYVLNKYWTFTEHVEEAFIPQFTKYVIVGGSGVVVNLATLAILQIAGFHDLVALSVALFLSIVNNYVWNYLWTFRVLEAKKSNNSVNDSESSHVGTIPEVSPSEHPEATLLKR